jgi:hypothetical protein
MKFLTAIITLATATTFAAPKTEVFNITGSVSLNQLHCQIGDMGSPDPIHERMKTVLPKPYIITGTQKKIELEHVQFSANGCDIAKLDQLGLNANQHFGFLKGVAIKITQDTSASRRASNGQCFARFTETVVLDLGQNVVLTSGQVKILLMNDCPAI